MEYKVVISPTEEHAKQTDWNNNQLAGSISRYLFSRRLLKETTTLTKAEYAELYNIPATIENEDGQDIPNPKYEALEDSYTLHKCASIVGDYLDEYDEEGNLVGYSSPYDRSVKFDVVEITEDDLLSNSEE